jgi:hypothetical protein
MVPFIGLIGCSPFSNLPEDVYDHVARVVEYSEAEAPFVEELAKISKKNTIFNAAREEGAEAFLGDHAQTLEDLMYYFSHDQIVGFYEDEYPKWENNAAFYRDRWFRENDFIAINLDGYKYTNSSVLIHEAGHVLTEGHPPSLDESHEIIYDASLAETVIQEQDYPYLLTLLYEAADRVLDDPHDFATRVVQNYQADVQRKEMTPEEAYDELTLLIQKGNEYWVQDVLECTDPNIDYTNTFGWSGKGFSDALRNSGMFESQQEMFREYICGFASEYDLDAKECK